MAVDITVYPLLSPRVVVIEQPQTEVTLQELIDTIRTWEDSELGFLYPHLIDASGKEELGGGVTVGITATLQNTQIRFAARPNPLATGVITADDTTGQFLTSSGVDFLASGVYVGCTAINETTTAMETIVDVDTELLTSFALQAGSRQDWQIGDSYSVYPNELCKITGGNLVAVNVSGVIIDPVLQAPNINILRSSSSSATLQELDTIQYAAFQNGAWLDTIRGGTGTTYPMGTAEFPVNNLADAKAIAYDRGFYTIYLNGNLTIQASDNVDELHLTGHAANFNTALTTITLVSGCSTQNTFYENVRIEGHQGGESFHRGCIIGEVYNTHCQYISCGMIGKNTVSNNPWTAGHTVSLKDCYTNDTFYEVDYNGSPLSQVYSNWSGRIKFSNITNPLADILVQIDSGEIWLDSSCTAGSITVRGVGTINDQSAGTTVNIDGLLSQSQLASAVWDEQLDGHLVAGSTGEWLKKKLLTVTKFLGLSG